jgi:hypothetical protein
MTTLDLSSAEAASSGSASPSVTLSAGWLVRRTVLWMLLVGLGIAGSCLLYTAVDSAGTNANTQQKSASLAVQP